MRISLTVRDVLHNLCTVMSYAQHIAISHASCECVINLAGSPADGLRCGSTALTQPNTSEGTWERWNALQQRGLLAALIQARDWQG